MKINLTNRMAAKIISRAMKHIAGEDGELQMHYLKDSKFSMSWFRPDNATGFGIMDQKKFENALVRLLEK